MKILLVNKFLYPRGGAETYMLKLGDYLQKAGHEVAYFGMYDKKNIVGNPWGLYTLNMDFHSTSPARFLYPFKIIYSFEAAKKMKKMIQEFRPDIIHLNNINFQLTPSVIDMAWKMKVPVVQTVHDSQMVCPGHLLYRLSENQLCQACVLGSKWNCARYRCIHHSFVKSILGSLEGIFYKYRKTYDKVRLFICPSRFMETILLAQKRFHGRTKVIHNFIEYTEKDYGEKELYILFFGRLSEEKGIRIFLDVCRHFSDYNFKIAGSGPLEKECTGLKNVEYLGLQTGEQLKAIVAKAQLVIYPSICYENCPLSILEAVSLGTPVIASSRGGSKELLENGKSGILIEEPFSSQKVIDVVEELLEQREKVEYMTKYCRESRKDLCTLDKYGERLERIYNRILMGKEI